MIKKKYNLKNIEKSMDAIKKDIGELKDLLKEKI